MTLQGSSLAVDQGMSCGSGFTSRGSIELVGARITGGLRFSGATLENPTGWALDAQGMSVGYALFIGSSLVNWGGLTVEGGLRLVGMRVDGFVCGWGAHIKACERLGWAIAGFGLQVTENVLWNMGFTADGKVDLTHAQVGSEINLDGARLAGAGGVALTAERLVVGASLRCTTVSVPAAWSTWLAQRWATAWTSRAPI
jgi:hypothetical protein